MQFRSKNGALPGRVFDNEVPMKKNPDDCYSPGFVMFNEARLKELREVQAKNRKRKT